MTHIHEDELVLHYYGEAGDPAGVEGHLASCPDCGVAFDALRRALDAVEPEPVPERGEDYGAEAWVRLRPRLERRPSQPLAFLRRRFVTVSAMAASLVLAFLLGRHFPRTGEGRAPIPVQARERILLLALDEHLERSRMVLVELANAPAGGPLDVTAERTSAEELVAANRLYRQTATRAGEVGVASVLEELERILVEVANGPAELEAAELEEIRQRIEERGILFKVRVMGSRVRQRERMEPKGGVVS